MKNAGKKGSKTNKNLIYFYIRGKKNQNTFQVKQRDDGEHFDRFLTTQKVDFEKLSNVQIEDDLFRQKDEVKIIMEDKV